MRIPLANLLAKSPFPRIVEQMAAASACAEMVPALVTALLAGDEAGVVRLAKETSILEGAADEVKNRVRTEMPLRIFLPVDRRDVLRLVSVIDRIADSAEDVGVLLTLRHLEVPEGLAAPLGSFTEAVMDTVATASRLVEQLDGLVRASFGGDAAEDALGLVQRLGEREHAADKLQDQCAKVLFGAEDQLAPVALFMWTKVLNEIGDIANHAENVGDQFRLFVAR